MRPYGIKVYIPLPIQRNCGLKMKVQLLINVLVSYNPIWTIKDLNFYQTIFLYSYYLYNYNAISLKSKLLKFSQAFDCICRPNLSFPADTFMLFILTDF